MIQTGNRNFWIAQIVGWSTISGSNLLVQTLAGFPNEELLFNSLTPLIVGFILTTIYRYIIRKQDWRNWNLNKTLIFLLGSTFILTSVFMVFVFFVFRFVLGAHALSMASFLGNMFFFTLIILTWNLIYFSIHYFNNWNQAEIEKWKLAAEIKDAQLGSLKSQIKPHFVFNTINNIRSLILEDKEKAREMLLNFSDLFRYALKNTDQSKVDLKEELEIVNQYLELISIQYEDKLQYKIQVNEGLEKFQLPPMMLQLLVENAVKHGISRFKEGGSIFIDIDQSDGFLNIRVKNTGSLNTASKLNDQLGVGLENIRKRLELIYNGKAIMKMSEIGNNVVATIKLPVL
jgi:two-component sensor histidine kinase